MKGKSSLKDREFHYGSIEMTEEEYAEAQNPKIRTTIFLEADLIRAYKQEAARRGLKYQQLIREKLRAGLRAPSEIEMRLKQLEKAVFKKKKRA